MSTTTAELDLKTWYVLHDGLPEDGSVRNSNPLAGSGNFESEMLSDFNDTINKGFADKDLGLFLVKLTDVKASQVEALESDLDGVVQSGFKGFNVEVVEAYKTALADWTPESLGDLDHLTEGIEPDADGWYRS